MIIPINVAPSSSSNPKLPPGLAKISHDEVVLIELQGALEVECNDPSERDGKLVGKLKVDPSSPKHRLIGSTGFPAIPPFQPLHRLHSCEFDQNKPTLLIGHHLLEGKIANLSKPLAVLLRSAATDHAIPSPSTLTRSQDELEGDDVEMLDFDGRSNEMQHRDMDNVKGVEWDVVAIVKRKIVFAKRPMPIVNLQK
ncbi:hypothetical protein H0H81_009147 [Sphagnurus paluster]|uniref:Chromosome transmission fidelity protein 8 n=1 Tax=Sphagnurus paluster TaxID=117069 RepID=A0A9P7GIK4_9AGAR|nr:hypothetical protein H0H81_009147 [Sphagnurus paluster]